MLGLLLSKDFSKQFLQSPPLLRGPCLGRLEKLVATLAAGDETGPLEATIKNLQREIDTKVCSPFYVVLELDQ